jgi:hypothetical protein
MDLGSGDPDLGSGDPDLGSGDPRILLLVGESTPGHVQDPGSGVSGPRIWGLGTQIWGLEPLGSCHLSVNLPPGMHNIPRIQGLGTPN